MWRKQMIGNRWRIARVKKIEKGKIDEEKNKMDIISSHDNIKYYCYSL